MATLISAPEHATPAWLTATLTAAGAAGRDARVVAVEREPIGAGKLASSVRFSLRWDGGRAGPRSVVGKFPSADSRSRSTGVASDAYLREVRFYRRLAPRVGLAVPRCYAAEADPSGEAFVLLLADVAPARPGDQVAGGSVDDVACALEALPGLQAPFWGAAGLARERWLPHRSASGGRRMAAAYRLLVGRFLAHYGSALSGGAVAALERFADCVRAWLRADEPPFTLLHGDFRVDNLLFGCGPGTSPVTVVDWQTVLVGPAASDAAYLVGGSLPVEARRRHEADLFGRYWEALRGAGVAPDRDACWRSWRANALAGLHMTVVGAMLVGEDTRSREMFVAMAERHAAHAEDLETFALLAAGR